MKEMWIIRFNDRDGEPAWRDSETGVPALHETKKDAVKASLENFISNLSNQLEDLDNDARDPDDVDFEHDEVVDVCYLHEDGSMTTTGENKKLYDPKTYKHE